MLPTGPLRLNYGEGIEIRNSSKELVDWENEELEEYSGLVEEEGVNHHPELAEYLPGVEIEQMVPGLEVAENEFSDA